MQARIEALRDRGVDVQVSRCDIANREDAGLDRLFATANPPVSGIVHLAGVVDDGVVAQQTWERFDSVFSRRSMAHGGCMSSRSSTASGNWCSSSSAAAVIGSPGQSGYAAANAFLDSLAARRAAMGEAALSVNWGVWDEVGMAARVMSSGSRRTLEQLQPMSSDGCFARLSESSSPERIIRPC